MWVFSSKRGVDQFHTTSRSWNIHVSQFPILAKISYFSHFRFQKFSSILKYKIEMWVFSSKWGVNQFHTTSRSWNIHVSQFPILPKISHFSHFRFQKFASILKYTIEMWVFSSKWGVSQFHTISSSWDLEHRCAVYVICLNSLKINDTVNNYIYIIISLSGAIDSSFFYDLINIDRTVTENNVVFVTNLCRQFLWTPENGIFSNFCYFEAQKWG